MISIDHVDQATIYLSKTGLDVEIVTTSTTGVNVCPMLQANLIADSSAKRERGRGLL